jgi:3-dehydroquinate dehydratase-2
MLPKLCSQFLTFVKMNILLIHGPNLNLLGTREPDQYGNASSETIVRDLKTQFLDCTIAYFQSNDEGELVNAIQDAKHNIQGILINAGGLSHSSISIADAIRSIGLPCISIHITNIYQRESYRHHDIVGEACNGAIVGLGIEGYPMALECLIDKLKK